ncbi:hypothetical protein WKI68_39600 [Streptomyces sp. MS1.HAVA.3]|uniref:Uncharacterized protein n=1 Tax=Streptomyces caledonius TaxID=3134107 RepID=A0ABU8UCR8_9ACTN
MPRVRAVLDIAYLQDQQRGTPQLLHRHLADSLRLPPHPLPMQLGDDLYGTEPSVGSRRPSRRPQFDQ